MKNLNQELYNYSYDEVHNALSKIKKKSYRTGLALGAGSSALMIGNHALKRHKKKKAKEAFDKAVEAKANQKVAKMKNTNESFDVFEKAISKKQKLFDIKVLDAIYNLNEDEYTESKMKNLYFAKQRDTALWQNNIDAATYYENLITL
jgi:predicted CopG family antitoxin